LTAPGEGDVPNVVYGVNSEALPEVPIHTEEESKDDITVEVAAEEESWATERIFSAASCTTNAISPVLKAISDHFGIVVRSFL
jgi:glyceraldehyde 3-phosphate dehydrogenase